jgi:maltose/moltooligosaccharide transporter
MGSTTGDPAAGTASTGATTEKNPYQVGTLVYTKMGLVGVFFWILWGDFCFQLMETIMPALLPLNLKDAGASDTWISLIVVTIPMILNATICPIVSFWSDRHRGPRGRRIPFLLWPTPFIALFIILTAYSGSVGAWLHAVVAAHTSLAVSKASMVILACGFCMVGFQFFNMFVGSVYYYLWADVVPEAFMARFMSLLRYVSQGASWIWSFYIFGSAEQHMKAIYIGIGIFYLVAFTMMSLKVKEGEYPPPPPVAEKPGLFGLIKTYFKECFRNPYYINFFAGTTLCSVAYCTRVFFIFLYRDQLGMTLDQVGKVNAWVTVASFILLFPAGFISDKIHPLRASLIGYAGMVVTSLLCFLFIHSRATMLICLLLNTLPETLCSVAGFPMYAALLPKDRYGQFCSAQAMLNSAGLIVGSALAGVFMTWVKDYQYTYMWRSAFLFLSLIPMLLVYRGWKKYGGRKNYVAPD